ncbi:hypothetical protein BRADI_2g44953v3 [Brachypodium distachyon]|uniref:Uncharacterized protein n=1 Tax=Brachypodium distachyon TaxID=15368 RepID=A0A2K2DDV9_BRADI|nr:hypothetical protein BRADI_2g44953v3 [Brachypodium distachyon]
MRTQMEQLQLGRRTKEEHTGIDSVRAVTHAPVQVCYPLHSRQVRPLMNMSAPAWMMKIRCDGGFVNMLFVYHV